MSCTLETGDQTYTRGIWRFNNFLLQDDSIEEDIGTPIKEYFKHNETPRGISSDNLGCPETFPLGLFDIEDLHPETTKTAS